MSAHRRRTGQPDLLTGMTNKLHPNVGPARTPADALPVTVSNWRKMNVFDGFDFSVVTRNMTSIKAGKPVYNHANVQGAGAAERWNGFLA